MHDKVVLLGDFVVCNGKKYFDNLVEQCHLESANKEPPCYESLHNSSCIELISTLSKRLNFICSNFNICMKK